jgi:hypothetical protein
MLGMPESNYSAVKRRLKCWLIAGFSLATARPEFPSVLDPSLGDGLPLHVEDRVRTATGERLYVILPIAGTRAARQPGGRARCRTGLPER